MHLLFLLVSQLDILWQGKRLLDAQQNPAFHDFFQVLRADTRSGNPPK